MANDAEQSQKDQPRQTPLHSEHQALGAWMVEFAGWRLPVQFSGIVEEHLATRSAAGLFDISHMGQVSVQGPQALALLQRLLTYDLSQMQLGQVIYSPMCQEQGGVLDDLMVIREDEDRYLLIVNAVNTDKDFRWISRWAEDSAVQPHSGQVQVEQIKGRAMLALQGPESEGMLNPLADADLTALGHHRSCQTKIAGTPALVSRTGYTGEDGFEMIMEGGSAPSVWRAILEAGKDRGLKPAGLGARDGLRQEMGYPLYGSELTEEITPLEAGLGWAVKFDKDDFIGREALLEQERSGTKRRLIGVRLGGRMIPRPGYQILAEKTPVGSITSGTFSPILKRGIGMGYVESQLLGDRKDVQVLIRGKPHSARIVEPPFIEKEQD